jgi:hypothetical protein
MESLGERLSPILVEIQDTLIDFSEHKPGFNNEGFRASIYIFQTAILDKMWELQEKENIPMDSRVDMAEKCGTALKDFVKTFADIDTHKLYK